MAPNSPEMLRRFLHRLPAVDGEEGILHTPIRETPAARRVRRHYEEYPYHPDPPREPLETRLSTLRRDWRNWIIPVDMKGRRTLDAGCGCGFNLALHGALASVAVGVDLSIAALRRARAYARAQGVAGNLFLIRGDIGQVPLPSGAFDLITCVGVLHHIPDHRAALANLSRLLSPEGLLLLGVYHGGARLRLRLKRALVRLVAGADAKARIDLARRLFDTRAEASLLGVPREIHIGDTYAVPVEKGFRVGRIARELGRVNLTLQEVRPSPSRGFRPELRSRARLPVDAGAVDRELIRLGQHHYWCLARPG